MTTFSIHCFGDSITQAGGQPECGRWTALLQNRLDQLKTDTYAVYNHGVGGNTSAMGLDRLRAPHIGPNLTIIEFGLNDCSCDGHSVKNRVSIDEYGANLQAMAEIVGKRGGKPILVANHLPIYVNEPSQPDGQLYSDKVRAYNDHVRKLCKDQGYPLIDAEAYFAAEPLAHSELRYDGLHLNQAGNRAYAEMVWHALATLLPDTP